MKSKYSYTKNYKTPQEIKQNFEVSVVMPFFKKLNEFKKVFPRNRRYLERNGIEVILVLDCPNEKNDLIEFVLQYPFVNWKILYNDKVHGWRNPTIPINVGIKHATKNYILICSPESEFFTDVILQLRMGLENYPSHFAIGTVCFVNENTKVRERNIHRFNFVPYGSIMMSKDDIFSISGYDESLNKWGGDDDNVRARLELSGIQEIFIPEVKVIHRDFDNKEGKKRRTPRDFPMEILEYFHYPSRIKVNTSWGEEFDCTIYDWENNRFASHLAEKYLTSFNAFSIKRDAFNKKYERLLLVPTYNEIKRLDTFFKMNAQYFDGIILLDDGSTDETYESADNSKLIMKVKKERIEFNDLENRNILLNLASFFKSKWICFIDMDEVLDDRFSDLDKFCADQEIDSVILNLIHVWDKPDLFNIEYPYAVYGISPRHRMFRNIGRTQIISNAKLHFLPVPYTGHTYHSKTIIRHFGNIDAQDRIRKYDFYMKEDVDKNQADYSHLLKNNVAKKRVDQITEDDLNYVTNILKR